MGEDGVSRRDLLAGNAAARALQIPRVERSQGVAPPRNPVVRVVTVGQDALQGRSNQELFEAMMARLNQAGSFHPDIACLPELASREPPESVPGVATGRLAAWARQHSSYVVFGLKTRVGDSLYNSAVIIDRQGRIAGQYNKIHPTESELADGIVPGDAEVPVFQTDFGMIGIQICFDVNWSAIWRHVKEKGAKIVFFPSAYPATRQIAALALMNQYYVVSSTQRGPSCIFDVTGVPLASSGHYQHWAAAAIPLGKRLFETDFHVEKARQIQVKYGSKVEITWFNDDSWFTLASLDPVLTVEDIMSEFGLTTLNDYRARATRAIDGARSR